MSQPIRNMAAAAQLDLSSVASGDVGMRNGTAPAGPQMMLDPATTPAMSNQPLRQMQHATQNAVVRGSDAQLQGLAGAQRNMELGATEQADAQFKAKKLLNDTKEMIIENSDASVMPMLLADKGLLEKTTRDTMQGMAVAQRTSPDLADYAGQLMA